MTVVLGPTWAYKHRDKQWSRFSGVGYGTYFTPDTALGVDYKSKHCLTRGTFDISVVCYGHGTGV